MSLLWQSAEKDLRRMRRDPAGLLLSAAIPLVIAFLLRLAFGGGGTATPKAVLLVADGDDSVVSGFFTGIYTRGPVADLIAVESVEVEAGRARMQNGEASALLVIPDGFGDAVLRNEPTALHLLTNPAQTILPGIIEETTSMFTEAAFYIQNSLGATTREWADGPPAGMTTWPDTTLFAQVRAVNRTVERVIDYLAPPVLTLEVETLEETRPAFNFGQMFLPGMLLMAILFVAQGMGDDLWKERDAGTLRRFLVSPGRLSGFVAGKLLASTAFVAGVGGVGLLAARFVFGVEIHHGLLAWLWLTASGVVLLLLLLLASLFATTARSANVFTTVILFPLLMLGGSLFPMEFMPEWLAAIGRWTPNGWALVELRRIIDGSITVPGLAAGGGMLALFAVLLFTLNILRLRAGFARG